MIFTNAHGCMRHPCRLAVATMWVIYSMWQEVRRRQNNTSKCKFFLLISSQHMLFLFLLKWQELPFVIVMKLVPNDPWVVFKERKLTMSNSVDVDIKKRKRKAVFPHYKHVRVEPRPLLILYMCVACLCFPVKAYMYPVKHQTTVAFLSLISLSIKMKYFSKVFFQFSRQSTKPAVMRKWDSSCLVKLQLAQRNYNSTTP